MNWIDRRGSKPTKYKEVVLVIDGNGYHGMRLAYFETGKGFIDMYTQQTVVCTHWCPIPKAPPMIDESATGIFCAHCGIEITLEDHDSNNLSIVDYKICHRDCCDNYYKTKEE